MKVIVVEMQSRPESFGLCYKCRDGGCRRCIGVPCECPCESPTEGREVKQ